MLSLDRPAGVLRGKESIELTDAIKTFKLDLRTIWRYHSDGGREMAGHLEQCPRPPQDARERRGAHLCACCGKTA